MIITTINAIKDTAARAFLQPYFAPNSAVAQRSFADAIRNSESDFSKHASDFELYELAGFDSVTGSITPLDEPRLIIRGKDLVVSSAIAATQEQH
jgi:hypothetical protein